MTVRSDQTPSVSWEPLPTFSKSFQPRKDATAVSLQYGKFLVLGGQTVQKKSRQDDQEATYNGTTKTQLLEWNMRRTLPWPSLQDARFGAAAVNYNDESLWVFGGANDEGRVLGSVEGFSLQSHHNPQWTWTLAPQPLPTPRVYAAAVAVPTEHAVLIVGGRNNSWQELNTMEWGQLLFDTDEQVDVVTISWTTLNNLNSLLPGPRMGCAAVMLNETSLVVMGGYDGRSWQKTCHMYEFSMGHVVEGIWKDLPDMIETVRFPKAVRYYKYLLVVGEKEESPLAPTSTTIIQCYDSDQRQWVWSKTCAECPSPVDVISLHGNHLYAFGAANAVAGVTTDKEMKKSASIFTCGLSTLDPRMVRASLPSVTAIAPAAADDDAPTIVAMEAVLVPEDESSSFKPPAKAAAARRGTIIAEPTEVSIKLRHVVKIKLSERSYYTGQLRRKDGTYVPHGQGLLVWVEEDKDDLDALRQSTNSVNNPPPSSYYKGQFLNGFRHGLGEMYLQVEDKHYFGAFEYGSWEGMGSLKIRSRGFSFFGQFATGEMTGNGRCSYRVRVGDLWKQKTYSGGFSRGLAHGKGVIADYLTGRIEEDREFKEEDLFGLGALAGTPSIMGSGTPTPQQQQQQQQQQGSNNVDV
ncbi:expressed unknown protein [Seminavis robusta]|uniref:Uncharacterized protein n=1 Tax=Seminavis robusta TaxID=568900 RepID=A0A9N8HI46_9STRA|nr:expressed unknown protein [Seminavis robusta]|eukprot:Sro481_g151490.1 n/a (634) ;mRNA; r:7575-9476